MTKLYYIGVCVGGPHYEKTMEHSTRIMEYFRPRDYSDLPSTPGGIVEAIRVGEYSFKKGKWMWKQEECNDAGNNRPHS